MKALMCPNCKAKIQADMGREYVFCTYCGDKISIRSLFAIQTEEEAQKKVLIQSKLEDGDAFDLNRELDKRLEEAKRKIRRSDKVLNFGALLELISMAAILCFVLWIVFR